jgi:hypothetical protein
VGIEATTNTSLLCDMHNAAVLAVGDLLDIVNWCSSCWYVTTALFLHQL